MGLREVNAARTRKLILDTALPLFLERGFEATRMEEIATAAGIGTSTLYRYYPSKEQLLLEPLSLRGHLAATLLERPAEDTLEEALGHSLIAFLTAPRADVRRIRQIEEVLARTPGIQARLLERFIEERRMLEEAVAQRLGRPADDMFCIATARWTTMVAELIVDQSKGGPQDPDAHWEHMMRTIHDVLMQIRAEPPAQPSWPREFAGQGS